MTLIGTEEIEQAALANEFDLAGAEGLHASVESLHAGAMSSLESLGFDGQAFLTVAADYAQGAINMIQTASEPALVHPLVASAITAFAVACLKAKAAQDMRSHVG